MNKQSAGISLSIAFVLLILTGCSTSQNVNPGIKSVFVSILPQKYFVERIGGDVLNVHVMVGPGQSPHAFEPTPVQLTALAESDIYFSIGIPFEDHLLKRLEGFQSEIELVNTCKGITLRKIASGRQCENEKHEHHDAEGDDPHTWLDPMIALKQTQTMYDALVNTYPEYMESFAAAFDSLKTDLNALDSALLRKLEPFNGSKLYVYHPAFGYFADRYGLVQTAVEIEGKEPTAKDIIGFLETADNDKPGIIFVQPQFSSSSAERIAETINAIVVPIDPMAYDYIENLMNIAGKISVGFNSDE